MSLEKGYYILKGHSTCSFDNKLTDVMNRREQEQLGTSVAIQLKQEWLGSVVAK